MPEPITIGIQVPDPRMARFAAGHGHVIAKVAAHIPRFLRGGINERPSDSEALVLVVRANRSISQSDY